MKIVSGLPYNAAMQKKGKKLTIWFSADQMVRLDAVLASVHKKHDRAKIAEVVKELMGYPPEEGYKPLITDYERRIISDTDPKIHHIHLNCH
jgi:hypothetical protein